jgi:hypothetical protein
MMLSSEEKVKRAAEIESKKSKIPEVKRRNEIKAGVITFSTGIGLAIALFTIMEGIVASGAVSAAAIAILSRVWVVGLIPIFVGLALIINGVFVSKKGDLPAIDATDTEGPELLVPAETNQLGSGVPFSVTDETTRHLQPATPAKRKTTEIP